MSYDVARTLRSTLLWRAAALLLGVCFVASVPLVVEPAEFGRFNVVFSAAQVLAAALLLWPNQGFLRQARQELHETGGLSGSLAARLALHLALSVLFIGVAIVASHMIADWLGLGRGIVAACVIGIALAQSTTEIGIMALQARARFETFNLAPIFQRAGQLCGLAAIAYASAADAALHAWALLAAGTIAGYLASGINAWTRVPVRLDWASAGDRARRIVGHSWTLPATSMAAFVLAWVDIWLINAFVGIEAAGVYSFAYLATTLATAILAPVVAALLPRSIDHQIAGDSASETHSRERIASTVLVAGALAPLAVVVVAAALAAIPLGSYAAARAPLVLLCAGIVFQLAMALGETVVYARADLVRRYALVVIGMVAVNAALDVALIPLIGVEGAAIATVATYAFGMVAQWWLIRIPGRRLELLLYTMAGFATATLVLYDSLAAIVAAGLVATAALCLAGWSGGRFAPFLALLPAGAGRPSVAPNGES